ncbi:tripartite tricarboxylate transporter substrate binding protein [Pseudoroseomonas cervicalis]|uniref:Bug family tripartite tricarboxylate transporter substrate binding protein n=1 Tax=Teichococcus cervicalis TaxID=204525 RepID=UPI002782FAAA|nr:tripartite tricarboxylate transporter substrate binding protein [Pseudoroseomonas cervicalis]MDQ1078927.1 tripartite-type tricarboxylate transporter receptor subunit TctC [Pseudoroseomonas cervicalis]
MNRRHLLRLGGLAAPALLLGRPLRAAEEWPAKPVTIIVPFAPGGSSDIIGRAVAQRMTEALGKPVVVENRPGAAGEIGARALARATPDGHLLMAAPISTFAINKALRPNLGYDPEKDFTNLTQSVSTPNVLVVNPRQVAANDLATLVPWLKRSGAQDSYSTSGVGSSDHLTMELFKQLTGTSMAHIPYAGGAPATTDLIAGNVQLSFQNLGFITPFIRDRQVKPILVTSEQRHPLLPEVPTAAEAGLQDFVVSSWQAMAAPPKMEQPLLGRVHAAIAAALRHPATVEQMDRIGFSVVASTPEAFQEFQRREIARWTEVVRRGNIQPA